MSNRLNQTNIALNPNVKGSQTPKDYRPINLCNVAYKIITKTLANGLKKVLLYIISQNRGICPRKTTL